MHAKLLIPLSIASFCVLPILQVHAADDICRSYWKPYVDMAVQVKKSGTTSRKILFENSNGNVFNCLNEVLPADLLALIKVLNPASVTALKTHNNKRPQVDFRCTFKFEEYEEEKLAYIVLSESDPYVTTKDCKNRIAKRLSDAEHWEEAF